jgi:hypothetical protein
MERRASPPVELCPPKRLFRKFLGAPARSRKIDLLRIVLQGPYEVAPASRRLYADISHAVFGRSKNAGKMPALLLRMGNTFVRKVRVGFLYRIEIRPPYHRGEPHPTGESPPAD